MNTTKLNVKIKGKKGVDKNQVPLVALQAKHIPTEQELYELDRKREEVRRRNSPSFIKSKMFGLRVDHGGGNKSKWRNHHIIATWLFVQSGFTIDAVRKRLGTLRPDGKRVPLARATIDKVFMDPYEHLSLEQVERLSVMLELHFLDLIYVLQGRAPTNGRKTRYKNWYDDEFREKETYDSYEKKSHEKD